MRSCSCISELKNFKTVYSGPIFFQQYTRALFINASWFWYSIPKTLLLWMHLYHYPYPNLSLPSKVFLNFFYVNFIFVNTNAAVWFFYCVENLGYLEVKYDKWGKIRMKKIKRQNKKIAK